MKSVSRKPPNKLKAGTKNKGRTPTTNNKRWGGSRREVCVASGALAILVLAVVFASYGVGHSRSYVSSTTTTTTTSNSIFSGIFSLPLLRHFAGKFASTTTSAITTDLEATLWQTTTKATSILPMEREGRAAAAWLTSPYTLSEFAEAYWGQHTVLLRNESRGGGGGGVAAATDQKIPQNSSEDGRDDTSAGAVAVTTGDSQYSLQTQQLGKMIGSLFQEVLDNIEVPVARLGIDALSRYLEVRALQYGAAGGHRHTELEPMRSPGAPPSDAPWDAKALLYVLERGFTLQASSLQLYGKNAAAVSRLLSDAMGHRVSLNMYVTPPNTRGFGPHFDAEDLFILQAQGSKRWNVYGRPVHDVVKEWGIGTFTRMSKQRDGDAFGPVLFDDTLHAGDVLYIPRGAIHHADTKNHKKYHNAASASKSKGRNLESDDGNDGGENSVHITAAVHFVVWADFLYDAIQAAARAPELDLTSRNAYTLSSALCRRIQTLAYTDDDAHLCFRRPLPMSFLQLPISWYTQAGKNGAWRGVVSAFFASLKDKPLRFPKASAGDLEGMLNYLPEILTSATLVEAVLARREAVLRAVIPLKQEEEESVAEEEQKLKKRYLTDRLEAYRPASYKRSARFWE